jgi:short subunit dehydrogenase-like uncharacterized protein
MSGKFMIYGATGYTGKLVARAARTLGMRPILAGRNEGRLNAIAGECGFDYRTIDLGDAPALRSGLEGMEVVLHIAGPFSRTSKPMLDACIAARVHYLDITGEIDVFEACASRDGEAREAGIMVMPGVGFDVVPSDCLMAHMKELLPDATEVTIAISDLGVLSRGTAKTTIETIAMLSRVRRAGRIVPLDAPPRREFDFGRGPKSSAVFGWGDVSTGYYSTGIPNITVYFETTPELDKILGLPPIMRRLLSIGPLQRMLKRRIDRQPEGPTESERQKGRVILLAEAANTAGRVVRARLETPGGYTLTAVTSLEIVRRVLDGKASPGFQTPSRVFGPDFILTFPGCVRQDLST